MKNLTFTKTGNVWVAYATLSEATNLHVERERQGAFVIMQKSVGTQYVEREGFGYRDSHGVVIDVDLEAVLYPKELKIISVSKPTAAVIGNPSNVICTDETNAELMNVARAQGWVAEDATEMTEGDVCLLKNLPGATIWANCITLDELQYFINVKSLGATNFQDCTKLTSITLPKNLTSIPNGYYKYGYVRGLFANCTSLVSVTIPNSVTSIGSYAFGNCTKLTSITIPNSVTSIGEGAFYCCSALTSVTIPNGVTSINKDTFSSCSALTSVTIPNSVTSIGDSAFYNCSALNTLTIPLSVTSFEDYAFMGTSDSLIMYCNPITPPTAGDQIFYYSTTRKIYVPSGSVEAYKTATNWTWYKNNIVAQS